VKTYNALFYHSMMMLVVHTQHQFSARTQLPRLPFLTLHRHLYSGRLELFWFDSSWLGGAEAAPGAAPDEAFKVSLMLSKS